MSGPGRVGRLRGATALGALLLAGALGLAACGSGGHHVSSPPTTGGPNGSATSATAATSAASAAATTGGSCIDGNWVTTSFTQVQQGTTMAGGAGIHFAITPSEISVSFTGMRPILFKQGSLSGQGIYSGKESAPFSPTSTGSSTGSFKLSPGTGDVTFAAKTGSGNYGAPIKASGFPSAGVTGTWVCSGSADATLTVPTANGPTTAVLTRDESFG